MSVRAAVIDIGSNSVRLLIVERGLRKAWRVIRAEREMVRLGAGIARTGRIDPAAMRESLRVITAYAAIARTQRADCTEIFATASVRDSSNGPAFAAKVRRTTALDVRILSAAEEGLLAFRGAAASFTLDKHPSAVADLGGGSLEVVQSARGMVIANDSVQLGALRMMEKFGGAIPASTTRFGALRKHVRATLRSGITRPREPVRTLVGGGGGFAAVLAMANATRAADTATRRDVANQLQRLRVMSLEERALVPGLEPRRADIIVPALCVVGELMDYLGADRFKVHANGVRDGMIMDVLERYGDTGLEGRGLGVIAHDFAALCPEELAHCEHVRELALQLLGSLDAHRAGGAWGGQEARELLEAGALMHDLGIVVDYPSHHLFSQAIIMNAHLPGWTERQRRIVALLARHHRKDPATPRGPTLKGLGPADARLVVRLGAVLRVADALDRSHKQRVARVSLDRAPDRAWELVIRARADVRRELRALWKKGQPLRDILGGELRPTVHR